ncbi:hypothetical protein FHW37_12513 [Neorhizobium alkalisoli]|uniref:Uncharacterized protein n=1 Tax=Neorhizobium alkalisoli TaxID=528178 RepID=A0A561PUQ8_9HYPH|nr:hypothetical protein FHW37_12513 [Neorhizobium alkalisoli]
MKRFVFAAKFGSFIAAFLIGFGEVKAVIRTGQKLKLT